MGKGKKYTANPSDGWIYEVLGFLGNGDAIVIAIDPQRSGELVRTVSRRRFFAYKEYKEPRKGIFWVNIYNYGPSLVHYSSREGANKAAYSDRIACVEVPWEEGQGM